MMIQSYLHSYEVDYVQDFSFLAKLAATPGVLAVVDARVYALYEAVLKGLFAEENLFLVEAREENKTPETALAICEKATGISAKRNLKIIAIGGGIVQDVAGFAAHILYRGVGFILVPTTLLAQGDSCIGSKNSINYLSYKNLLGTIYPPEKVYVCNNFTTTLTDLDFHSGLGEVLRFCIMDDLSRIPLILADMDKLLARDAATVQNYVRIGHAYKKAMVERDEFDLRERRIFNYGHTFGHAFEALTNFAIPHGLAIVLGMVTANRISLARGILDLPAVQSIEELCRKLYNAEPFICTNSDALIDTVKKDKKRQGDGIAAVLLSANGSFEVVQDVHREEILAAIPYAEALSSGGRP